VPIELGIEPVSAESEMLDADARGTRWAARRRAKPGERSMECRRSTVDDPAKMDGTSAMSLSICEETRARARARAARCAAVQPGLSAAEVTQEGDRRGGSSAISPDPAWIASRQTTAPV